MALVLGMRLGPYEIIAPLGAGGMGEVYRARDTRLQRDVAIKVLPADVAGDSVRLMRFAQEARATAALNHPNILSIFDVAIDGPTPYLVSELLDGATLGERLRGATGKLAVSRTVDYATQIAQGLSAAHARGIVHRDLKPDNVFVTTDGRIKLLDFGLAKPMAPLGDTSVTTGEGPVRTDHGQVLGTLGYMAPEQLRGQTVDARADVFSFGAVLYEMLAGRRPFLADSPADIITAILSTDPPDLTPSPDLPIPPAIVRIVTRCLEKDPAARFQSSSDLAFALSGVAGSGSAPVEPDAATPGRSARPFPVGVVFATAVATAVITLAGAALWTVSRDRARPPAPVVRFTLLPPDDAIFGTNESGRFAVSPDGRWIAFVAQDRVSSSVWVRAIEATVPRKLEGTEGVSGNPIWSPDGRSLAFFADARLKRVDVNGGVPRTLCDLPGQRREISSQVSPRGSWNANGDILFATHSLQPIHRVSAEGGSVSSATVLPAGGGEGHGYPSWMPDGRHFTFVVTGPADRAGVWLGSIDDSTPIRLMDVASYAPYALGHLLFVRNGALMARPFDSARNQFAGEARPVDESVRFGPLATANFNVSETGVLVYAGGLAGDRQLVWVDRSGVELGKVGQPTPWGNFALSRDGMRVVISRSQVDPSMSGLSGNIWLLDLARTVETQLTFSSQRDSSPVWSPDGQRIAFSRADTLNRYHIVVMPAAGGPGTVLYTSTAVGGVNLDDWSPDGQVITFNQDPSLWAISTSGDGKPRAFVETQASVDESHFSPDGRWIAYNSNESGTWQVSVAPWPTTGERWQVSADGGVEARWRTDGRELFFLALDGTMMSVTVTLTPRLVLGQPRVLFRSGIGVNARQDNYAVSPDGQRFLLRRQIVEGSRYTLTVVVNWQSALGLPGRP